MVSLPLQRMLASTYTGHAGSAPNKLTADVLERDESTRSQWEPHGYSEPATIRWSQRGFPGRMTYNAACNAATARS
jgi:hypothetical protein